MIIKNISIKDISKDENQPRKFFDEEAIERLSVSIKENGIESPITIRKNGSGYILIDGERRWIAAQKAGLKELPCIISEKEDILEQQLRSDCLKEGLTPVELDKAIFEYSKILKDTTSNVFNEFRIYCNTNNKRKNEVEVLYSLYSFIEHKIGKSIDRIRIAIDRHTLKKENPEFTEKIEKKYNPEKKKFNKVDSTIAITNKSYFKDKPELRKAIIEEALEQKKRQENPISNADIKEKLSKIEEREITDPKDAVALMRHMKLIDNKYDIKKDPRNIFQDMYFNFDSVTNAFEIFTDKFYDSRYEKFETVKEHIKGECLNNFIEEVQQHIKNVEVLLCDLKNLKE